MLMMMINKRKKLFKQKAQTRKMINKQKQKPTKINQLFLAEFSIILFSFHFELIDQYYIQKQKNIQNLTNKQKTKRILNIWMGHFFVHKK